MQAFGMGLFKSNNAAHNNFMQRQEYIINKTPLQHPCSTSYVCV